MGDGYIDTDGTDLVYGLNDLFNLFVYIVAYQNKCRSFTLNLKGNVLKMVLFVRLGKKF